MLWPGTDESGRAISVQRRPRWHVRLQAGCLSARRGGSQPKISKTTPCKVAGGRRQGRFGPTLDTAGKSTALLHHRTIRKTPAGPQRRAVRCDVGRKSPPTIEVALALEVA